VSKRIKSEQNTIRLVKNFLYNLDNCLLSLSYCTLALSGDTESLWNVDKLRSETYTQHTLSGAFSCAKGFLLEHKPEEAAAVIQIICQAYPDEKKSALEAEFKKLVNEWSVDIIKHQNEQDKKDVAASLKSDIPAMVNALVNSGLRVRVDLNELNKNEALLS
jgi:hypothetical protein